MSPNELSFATANSLTDIYGHAKGGASQPIKSKFYDMYGSGYDSLCIGSERDPKRHGRMKKSLAAAFSTKALSEQEDIINGCVDHFVDAIAERLDGDAGGKGLNMTKWYEMLSFDILGEMAFGESFHAVKDGTLLCFPFAFSIFAPSLAMPLP